MEKEIHVTSEHDGKRLDKFLSEAIGKISRQKVIASIDKGLVVVDGKRKKASFKVAAGQVVNVEIEEEKTHLTPYQCDFPIVYEDDDLLVLEKPSGLVVHPPHSGYNTTLVNALLNKHKALYPSEPLRPGIVHRLDKETSGVMVVAKSELAYKDLVQQFKERRIKKEYRAICHGIIKKDTLSIDLPLARDKKNRLKMKVSLLQSKEALTEVVVLKRLKHSTYVSLKILTGRMHQIRVHMKFMGHPLVGDKKYGKRDDSALLFLHAYRLGFVHPRTKKELMFIADVPQEFSDFLNKDQ